VTAGGSRSREGSFCHSRFGCSLITIEFSSFKLLHREVRVIVGQQFFHFNYGCNIDHDRGRVTVMAPNVDILSGMIRLWKVDKALLASD
jgi:hypothetical protein